MGQHLLPIRILFHATFAFVYLPIFVLAFTSGLSGREKTSFIQAHMDGISALAALVGLGIFTALDILTIRRKVNQRALLIVEITVVALMPLSMWPIIISSISVVWNDWFVNSLRACWTLDYEVALPQSWYCYAILLIGTPIPGDEVTSAGVVSATVAILALNAAFFLYIGIVAVRDKFHGKKFLVVYPEECNLSSPGTGKKCYLFGAPRTPTERAVMISRCTDYIFRNSVFRKHAFEPTIWAVFRGIVAVYSCVGLVAFSFYSVLSEAELRGTLTVKETISAVSPYAFVWSTSLSVASFLMGPQAAFDAHSTVVSVDPKQNPSPTLSGSNTSGDWQNPSPGFWAPNFDNNYYMLPTFNISWAGEYTLVTWVISDGFLDDGSPIGTGSSNTTPFNFTNPLVLAPFKKYSVSIISVWYQFSDCSFILWIPDMVTSVDSDPGSNTSMATFSFNGYQRLVLNRDFLPPSMFSSVAHVISAIGGTLSAIDGFFALIFGRTILAIIFGTRTVSPFGLLGMFTRNRFKRLIHEQYPRMKKDIEEGGMAAYISDVAIDTALMDPPFTKGITGSTDSSSIGDDDGSRDDIVTRRRQLARMASHTSNIGSLPNPLLGTPTDHV